MPLFRRTTGGAASSSDTPALTSYNYSTAGRLNLFTETWITMCDDLLGPLSTTHAESGLAGVDPLNEFEHLGWTVREGDIIRSWEVTGRATAITTLTDVEYLLQYLPFPDSVRNGSGLTSDTGFSGPPIDLVRNLWTLSDLQPPTPVGIGGSLGRLIHKDHRDLDFVVPSNGVLKLWFRGVFSAPPTGSDRFSNVNNIIIDRPPTSSLGET